MNSMQIFKRSVLASSLALLTACGGGGGGGAASNGTTVGVVTGFGSVYINGVEYETDSASIHMDDRSVAETSLGVGDVCTLRGSVNADGVTGTASSVSCRDELEGYVLDLSSLAADGTGQINVMGQTVTVTADSVFDSDTLAAITDLAVNDIVEVSGFSDGAGNILATRIETKNAAEDVEIKGLVSGLDSTAMTFNIGGLVIDYSSASEVTSSLADGLYVEVKTTQALSGSLATGFTLTASKVEMEDDGDMDIDGEIGEDYKVQGMVSDVTATSFRFNGILVEFAALESDDDFNLGSLVDGMMITVEGYIDPNGQFVVTEIEDHPGTELEAEGTVTSKTDTSVTLLLANSDSITVVVNNSTRMIDEQDEYVQPLHYFSLSDVAIGDFLEVEYYQDEASGDNIATELERDDPPSI